MAKYRVEPAGGLKGKWIVLSDNHRVGGLAIYDDERKAREEAARLNEKFEDEKPLKP